MNISSAQVDYSTISNDTITTSQFGNVTIPAYDSTTGSSFYYTGAGIGAGSGSTITISNGGSSVGISTATLNVGSLGTSTYTFQMPEDWKDQFPSWNEVQSMCEEYPGLKIAFEKFKTTYLLVKNHYDTPEDQRPRP